MRPTLIFFSCLLPLFAHLQAQPGEDPEPYYLFSIYFGGGSYYIDPEQTEALYEWLDGIPGLEDHEISIHGHTDDIGGKEYNQVLSQFRSEQAFQKLIEKGIPKEQILLKDFGELNPLYDNNTWEGRRKNRRVDIIVKPLVL
ncbi:MAG: OmpA family protein [Haliscomenobacter sp.]|nr:OmpA family protein [Haliscomenobacter sp.]